MPEQFENWLQDFNGKKYIFTLRIDQSCPEGVKKFFVFVIFEHSNDAVMKKCRFQSLPAKNVALSCKKEAYPSHFYCFQNVQASSERTQKSYENPKEHRTSFILRTSKEKSNEVWMTERFCVGRDLFIKPPGVDVDLLCTDKNKCVFNKIRIRVDDWTWPKLASLLCNKLEWPVVNQLCWFDLISIWFRFDFIYLRRVALRQKPFFKGPSNKNIIIIITNIPKKTIP